MSHQLAARMKSLNLVYRRVRFSFVISKSYYTSSTAAVQNPTPHFHQNPNPNSRVYQNTNTYRNKSHYPENNYENMNTIPQYDGNVSNEKLNHVVDAEEEGLRGTIEELDAFCEDRKLKEAVEVLGLLIQNGVSVDVPRFLFLMSECGEAQALQQAKQVHEVFLRSVTNVDVSVSNKVLEMFSKCGSMEDAYNVFDKMPQRNFTTWDTMITGFANNGHGEDAIDMFTEFKKIGLKPDSQMFYGVFTACSVVGDMKEGLLHFESMSKDYNIVPSMEHYKSVVDMLGSGGYLNEALEFIDKMPMEPTVDVWEALLKQCRVYGETELGDRCSELIQLLDPSRLDEQSKAGLIPVKASDIAKEKEKKKLAGYNPLEIKTKVYEYRAGDTSHPEHKKLYSQLRCLKHPMKEVGYVPETKFVLHDIDPESKEEALLAHSERLALSQALLTSSPRAPIRIIKNLRVCGDCHNALKIISKIVGRLIVARDAKRFHHFENGVTSHSCSAAESIVKDEVSKAFSQDKGLAAGLVRLYFTGCDGSVLIDLSSNTAETDSPTNNPLLCGFIVIDDAKTRLETVCPGVVSCADIVAVTARDGFQITGGLEYDVPAGRRDGRVSLIAAGTIGLPPHLVVLEQCVDSRRYGAHTIGRSHSYFPLLTDSTTSVHQQNKARLLTNYMLASYNSNA